MDNAFQTPFSAEITGPQTTPLVLPGFFDGYEVWKTRVFPTAEGDWQITTAGAGGRIGYRMRGELP